MEININSPQQLSLLFFGGYIEEECQVPILNELGVQEVYKTKDRRGELKFKKGKVKRYIKGLGLRPLEEWKTKKEGIYSTDEKVLKIISSYEGSLWTDQEQVAAKIAKLMLRIRELEKLKGTYYDGFNKYIYDIDSCIRGNLVHFSTDTGRLSSNKPNLQNIPL